MNVQLPRLYPWQQQVVNNLSIHQKGYFHIVRSKRQCGKSILLECIMIKSALENPKSKNYCVCVTFVAADKIINEIYDLLKSTGLVYKMNMVNRQVTFKNGSVIRIFSAEQGDSLRGWTVTGVLIYDEAAYISDSIIDLTLAWTNTTNAPVIMFSTPASQTGRFYEMDMAGLTDPNIFSYCWNEFDTSALLTPARLELYRRTVDPLKFRTDYMGEYLENQSGVFGDYSQCLYDKPNVDKTVPVYAGIDWSQGIGKDYNAITIIDKNNNLVDMLYFNNSEPNKTIDRIVEFISQYNVQSVIVEMNSIGTVYYGLLKDRLKQMDSKINLLSFYTTNESKDRIISNLMNLIQNNQIKFYNDLELITELQNYDMEFSKTGKRVFNAKQGFHDDILMSLAIALSSINKGKYHIGFA